MVQLVMKTADQPLNSTGNNSLHSISAITYVDGLLLSNIYTFDRMFIGF